MLYYDQNNTHSGLNREINVLILFEFQSVCF